MEQEKIGQQPTQQETNQSYLIPGAIVLAGIIIAGVIYYTNSGRNKSAFNSGPLSGNDKVVDAGVESIKPISDIDHIFGDSDASVKIVEFSDLECPFCKKFHFTMRKIMDEYGADGRVAWIYRHFPLDALHSQARKEAVATECANELGGNEKFWQYVDKIFEITPSNNDLDLELLPKFADELGFDKNNFGVCLNSKRYNEHIQADVDDAQNSGAQGTPYTVVIVSNGKKFVINGAQPYEQVKSIIEKALAGK